VSPLHCTVLLVPWVGLNACCADDVADLQIRQAVNPDSLASASDIFEETFSTIRQVERWYFLPLGVLYTVWDLPGKVENNTTVASVKNVEKVLFSFDF
jgi:hypothetical protein